MNKTNQRVEAIRSSAGYMALNGEERAAVDASPLYMREDYIRQLLAARGVDVGACNCQACQSGDGH